MELKAPGKTIIISVSDIKQLLNYKTKPEKNTHLFHDTSPRLQYKIEERLSK